MDQILGIGLGVLVSPVVYCIQEPRTYTNSTRTAIESFNTEFCDSVGHHGLGIKHQLTNETSAHLRNLAINMKRENGRQPGLWIRDGESVSSHLGSSGRGLAGPSPYRVHALDIHTRVHRSVFPAQATFVGMSQGQWVTWQEQGGSTERKRMPVF